MDKEKLANKIYDILVKDGGASESIRSSFVYDFCSASPATEWRFIGQLEFGGKFRNNSNLIPCKLHGRYYVDCYPEDLTKKRSEIIKKINSKLKDLEKEGDGEVRIYVKLS